MDNFFSHGKYIMLQLYNIKLKAKKQVIEAEG